MTVRVPMPIEAPAGQHWERSALSGFQLLPVGGDYRKCTFYLGPVSTRRSPCNARAVVLDEEGHLRCAEHLRQRGIWINMGVAWEWALTDNEEQA